MSASVAKMTLADAAKLAEEIRHALEPACFRIEVAGSVRRRKPEVGDIEMVCISRPLGDLFGEPCGDELSVVLEIAARSRGWTNLMGGDKYKKYDLGTCMLDLFIVTPETWGVQFTLRTGPADFSRNMVTPKIFGGFLPQGYKVAQGRLWDFNGNPVETPEEIDFFKAIGKNWVDPAARSGKAEMV